MKYERARLVAAVILTLCLIMPLAMTSAQKNQDPIIIYNVPHEYFLIYNNNEEMPNGYYKVDIGYRFYWLDEEFNELGIAEQYIIGVKRTGKAKEFESLRGYGIFVSNTPDKPGTITYTIGNHWDRETNEMWALRLRIVCGTESFEGIKGPGKLNIELFAFELYVNFNPWE